MKRTNVFISFGRARSVKEALKSCLIKLIKQPNNESVVKNELFFPRADYCLTYSASVTNNDSLCETLYALLVVLLQICIRSDGTEVK